MNTETFSFIGSITPWLMETGVAIVAIFIGAWVIMKLSGVFVAKGIRKIIVADRFLSHEAETKREDTLIRITTSTLNVLIIIITLLMILQQAGVAIAPLIAAMGIAGVALGFGGQYLIRDIITGLFMILENQYRVGDTVCFNDTCGSVEDITLRMTSLRDLDGTLHHVPHGEITKVSNKSKYFSRVNLDIGVGYSADIEKVASVIDRVGSEIANDATWKDKIIEAPKFLRVQSLADSAVVVKVLGKTKPGEHWGVEGEFRKRVKLAFDAEGIEIPFPQLVIHKEK